MAEEIAQKKAKVNEGGVNHPSPREERSKGTLKSDGKIKACTNQTSAKPGKLVKISKCVNKGSKKGYARRRAEAGQRKKLCGREKKSIREKKSGKKLWKSVNGAAPGGVQAH